MTSFFSSIKERWLSKSYVQSHDRSGGADKSTYIYHLISHLTSDSVRNFHVDIFVLNYFKHCASQDIYRIAICCLTSFNICTCFGLLHIWYSYPIVMTFLFTLLFLEFFSSRAIFSSVNTNSNPISILSVYCKEKDSRKCFADVSANASEKAQYNILTLCILDVNDQSAKGYHCQFITIQWEKKRDM